MNPLRRPGMPVAWGERAAVQVAWAAATDGLATPAQAKQGRFRGRTLAALSGVGGLRWRERRPGREDGRQNAKCYMKRYMKRYRNVSCSPVSRGFPWPRGSWSTLFVAFSLLFFVSAVLMTLDFCEIEEEENGEMHYDGVGFFPEPSRVFSGGDTPAGTADVAPDRRLVGLSGPAVLGGGHVAPEPEVVSVRGLQDGKPPPQIRLVGASAEEVIREVFGSASEAALAVAWCESSFDPGATGAAGELGLFQILPWAHPVYDQGRLYEAEYNAAAAYAISDGGTDWSAWTCRWVVESGE